MKMVLIGSFAEKVELMKTILLLVAILPILFIIICTQDAINYFKQMWG